MAVIKASRCPLWVGRPCFSRQASFRCPGGTPEASMETLRFPESGPATVLVEVGAGSHKVTCKCMLTHVGAGVVISSSLCKPLL